MTEKFIEKIDRFMDRLLAVPPTMEELLVNFPHSEGCDMTSALKIVEKSETIYVGEHGAFDMSPSYVDVTRKYLECDSCHIQSRFSE